MESMKKECLCGRTFQGASALCNWCEDPFDQYHVCVTLVSEHSECGCEYVRSKFCPKHTCNFVYLNNFVMDMFGNKIYRVCHLKSNSSGYCDHHAIVIKTRIGIAKSITDVIGKEIMPTITHKILNELLDNENKMESTECKTFSVLEKCLCL